MWGPQELGRANETIPTTENPSNPSTGFSHPKGTQFSKAFIYQQTLVPKDRMWLGLGCKMIWQGLQLLAY